jgi:hypothetical protein
MKRKIQRRRLSAVERSWRIPTVTCVEVIEQIVQQMRYSLRIKLVPEMRIRH